MIMDRISPRTACRDIIRVGFIFFYSLDLYPFFFFFLRLSIIHVTLNKESMNKKNVQTTMEPIRNIARNILPQPYPRGETLFYVKKKKKKGENSV